MTKTYEERVEIFEECIALTSGEFGEKNLHAAIAMAYRKYDLNAADSAWGITSDQAAWQEAANL